MKAIISNIKQETLDVKTFTFDLDEELEFKSGQFIRLTIPNCDIPRPFSMSSAGGKSKQIKITIKIYKDGRFTKKVNQLSKRNILNIIFQARKILNKAIIFGGSSIRDFRKTDGVSGNFQQYFKFANNKFL